MTDTTESDMQATARAASDAFYARSQSIAARLWEIANEMQLYAIPSHSQARELGEMLERVAYAMPRRDGIHQQINISVSYGRQR